MITFMVLVVGCIALLFVGLLYGIVYAFPLLDLYAFPLLDLAVFFLLCYGIYKLCHLGKNKKDRSKKDH